MEIHVALFGDQERYLGISSSRKGRQRVIIIDPMAKDCFLGVNILMLTTEWTAVHDHDPEKDVKKGFNVIGMSMSHQIGVTEHVAAEDRLPSRS